MISKASLNLPSWCPDWSQPLPRSYFTFRKESIAAAVDYHFEPFNDSALERLSVQCLPIATVTSVFKDGSIESIPSADAEELQAPDPWPYTATSAVLTQIAARLREHSGGNLKQGDLLCLLAYSTGFAILRSVKHGRWSLVVLENSQFPEAYVSGLITCETPSKEYEMFKRINCNMLYRRKHDYQIL